MKSPKRANKFRSFFANRTGGVALMYGLLFIPLVFAASGGIEYSNAVQIKTRTTAAADAAVLAAVSNARNLIGDGVDDGTALSRAQAFGEEYFVSATSKDLVNPDALQLVLSKDGEDIKAELSFPNAELTPIFSFVGDHFTQFRVDASAELSLARFIEIHFVVDTSMSMGIGATAIDQQTIASNGYTNCAVACHNANPGWGDNIDDIRATGAVLRVDVVRDALVAVLDRLRTWQTTRENISVAVHTFSNTLTTRFGPDTNIGAARNDAVNIDLGGGFGEGGTNTTHALATLATSLGTSGSGLTSDDPQIYIVLLTDGVQTDAIYVEQANGTGRQEAGDPNFVNATPFAFRSPDAEPHKKERSQTLDPAACNALSTVTGADILVLTTTYLIPVTGNDDYNTQFNRLLNVVNNVPTHSATCATRPDFVFTATSPQEIEAGFVDSVNAILEDTVPRLTH